MGDEAFARGCRGPALWDLWEGLSTLDTLRLSFLSAPVCVCLIEKLTTIATLR